MPAPTLTTDRLRQEADALGFLACGVAHLGPSTRAAALDDWLARGLAGTMRYLHRQARRRKQPALIVPEARVAVVVLENYAPARPADNTPAPVAQVAAYARGEDYHHALIRRLDHLAAFLRQHGARVAHSWADSGPVPERELAERAGLGWIGKNTMLIRPGTGSLCFIGTIFTDLELTPDAPFTADHCGTCTACLDACPTGALVAPRVLDATRCISYLTIESRSPAPASLVPKLSGWAFGCDICNDVCPWNERFAEPSARPEYQPRPGPDLSDPDYFDRLTEEEFTARFADTPLARVGLPRMRRNWRLAVASRPDPQPGGG